MGCLGEPRREPRRTVVNTKQDRLLLRCVGVICGAPLHQIILLQEEKEVMSPFLQRSGRSLHKVAPHPNPRKEKESPAAGWLCK